MSSPNRFLVPVILVALILVVCVVGETDASNIDLIDFWEMRFAMLSA